MKLASIKTLGTKHRATEAAPTSSRGGADNPNLIHLARARREIVAGTSTLSADEVVLATAVFALIDDDGGYTPSEVVNSLVRSLCAKLSEN
jgi:hypothetical protein